VLRRLIPLALLAGFLVAPAGASATGLETTWDQAAGDMDFPVYQPTQTLGLRLTALSLPTCELDTSTGFRVSAVYGNRRSSRGSFSIAESFPLCGNAGEERVVRRVTINGVKVDVAVNCRPSSCRVTANDGPRLGFRLLWRKGSSSATFIDLRTRHLSLARALRVARSLSRVTLDRPTLQLLNFVSPDRQVWCGLAPTPPGGPQEFCGTASGGQFATVDLDGTLTLCDHPNPSPAEVCVQNFDDEAPVLGLGQASEFRGFRCVSEMQGITCTVMDTGKGFSMSATTLTPVGM
jgi:hypothetical protein